MALEVIAFQHTATDEHWEDVVTYFATHVAGDYCIDLNDGKRIEGFESRGWRIQDTDLVVYPDDVDQYIELLTRIKAKFGESK